MKALGIGLFLLGMAAGALAAPPAPASKATGAKPVARGSMRTIANLPGFPLSSLKRLVSTKFYKSLLISPVEGYIVVRGHLSSGRFHGGRVTHSELGGAFDEMAIKLANNFTITGAGHMGQQLSALAVHQYLVIYKIADGMMALSFPVLAEAGKDQDFYYGSAFLAVYKDGKWTEIKGPEIRRR